MTAEKNESLPLDPAPLVHEVTCPSCHGETFTVLDDKTGVLRCAYCHNQWIDKNFIKVTETERFLQEQAKQPKIIIDNTTETDKQLMNMFSGLFGAIMQGPSLLRGLRNILLTVLGIFVALIVALALWGFFSPLG
jgi:hypothetical protein